MIGASLAMRIECPARSNFATGLGGRRIIDCIRFPVDVAAVVTDLHLALAVAVCVRVCARVHACVCLYVCACASFCTNGRPRSCGKGVAVLHLLFSVVQFIHQHSSSSGGGSSRTRPTLRGRSSCGMALNVGATQENAV
jgi:hypothetical protein